MSDISQGPGWWQASDAKWYPPETHPDYQAPAPAAPPAPTPPSGADGPPTYGAPAAFGGPPVAGQPTAFDAQPAFAAPGAPTASEDGNKNRLMIAGAALGALVLLIGAVAFISRGSDDDDPNSIAFTSTTVPDVPEVPEVSVADDPVLEGETDPAPSTTVADSADTLPAPSAEGTCVVTGVDTFDDIQVTVSIVGPFDERGDVWVDYDLYDGDVVFGDSFVYLPGVGPGEQIVTDSDSVTDLRSGTSLDNVTCQITEVSDAQFGEFYGPSLTDTCDFIEVDSFGDMQFALEVTNSTGQTGDLTTNFALYSDDIRVSSSSHYAEAVAPGEVLSVDVDSLLPPPEGVDPASLDCRIISFYIY